MKIISNKQYEEYEGYKRLANILESTNVTLRTSLDNAKKDIKKYKEELDKLKNPVKRKVGRPRKESK